MRAGAQLQTAIWKALTASQDLAGIPVWDAPPAGARPELWVHVGEDDARAAPDASADGSEHFVKIWVEGVPGSYARAKGAAAAIFLALEALPEVPGLVNIEFRRSRARNVGGRRRIEMIFRARMDFEGVGT
jgi:hypothetical protein